jgi:hypothetical protein
MEGKRIMKKALGILAMVLTLPLAGLATEVSIPECVTGTYADYMALENGCTVGDKVFSDFDYAASGTNQLSAAQVTVTPDNSDPMNPGLLFTGTWVANAGNTSDSHLQFTVSTLSGAALIEDASLSISGYAVSGTGMVTVAENLCLGGTFSGWTTNCSSQVTDNLLVSTFLGQTYDHTTFNPVSTVDVFKDIGLTAFGTGETNFAFVSGVTNNFSQVPEPATLTLLGTGLLAIGEKLRRRKRQSK